MKIIRLLLFYVSLTTLFTTMVTGQTTFFKIIDRIPDVGIYDVIESSDNSYILTGFYDSTKTEPTSSGYLLKIDEEGVVINEVIQQHGNSSASIIGIAKIQEIENRYLICEHIDSLRAPDLRCSRIIISILEESLDLTTCSMSNTIEDSVFLPQRMLISESNTAYFFGMTYALEDMSGSMWLAKSFYPYPSIEFEIFPESEDRIPNALLYNFQSSTLNGFYFGGLMENLISPVKLFDADTSLQFLGSIPLPDLFRVQVSACHNTDTTYLVTATSTLPECRGIIIGEFDYRTHDTLRTFRYRFSPDTILYNCLGSTVMNGNGIFITGVYNLIPSQFPYQQSPMWIVITKLDHQFNVVSHHFYGGDAAYYSYKTIETSDGCLLSVGRRWDNSAYPQLNTDPFALKVNSDGMVVSAGSPDDERISEAILFPNPANDKVNIIMGNQVKHATVVFCNASGQIILQDNLDQPVNTRDVSSYPPGMYLYKIFSGKKMIGSGKWIKQ